MTFNRAVKIHRCQDMLLVERARTRKDFKAPRFYYVLEADGDWVLMEGRVRADAGHRSCMFCGYYIASYCQELSVSRPHRCVDMAAVEGRRNENKAKTPGQRSYQLRWDSTDGWAVFNCLVKSNRIELKQCPFCFVPLPDGNRVTIE